EAKSFSCERAKGNEPAYPSPSSQTSPCSPPPPPTSRTLAAASSSLPPQPPPHSPLVRPGCGGELPGDGGAGSRRGSGRCGVGWIEAWERRMRRRRHEKSNGGGIDL
uniref:Uncharacterized protein n=1 Tax=Aegilops tauschii subsp. strangulata TaxID=200361 RepID=A0A452Y4E6_AEGTS